MGVNDQAVNSEGRDVKHFILLAEGLLKQGRSDTERGCDISQWWAEFLSLGGR
jgi:hypothetical protein